MSNMVMLKIALCAILIATSNAQPPIPVDSDTAPEDAVQFSPLHEPDTNVLDATGPECEDLLGKAKLYQPSPNTSVPDEEYGPGYDCEDLARMHVCNHREHGPGITAMCAKSCGACSTSCGASTATTATDADDDDRNDDGTGSIILGQNAGTTEWPSFVRLSTGCGASLIAHDKILTAAHCVTKGSWLSSQAEREQLKSDITAHVGWHSGNMVSNVVVDTVATHPDWVTSSSSRVDLAVITLSQCYYSHPVSQLAAVDAADATDALPTHADMWAIGRGYTKLNTDPYPGHSSVYTGNTPAATLQEIKGRISKVELKRSIFTVPEKGSVCQGDSGSPLYRCPTGTTTGCVQVGVASANNGCQNGALEWYPKVVGRPADDTFIADQLASTKCTVGLADLNSCIANAQCTSGKCIDVSWNSKKCQPSQGFESGQPCWYNIFGSNNGGCRAGLKCKGRSFWSGVCQQMPEHHWTTSCTIEPVHWYQNCNSGYTPCGSARSSCSWGQAKMKCCLA